MQNDVASVVRRIKSEDKVLDIGAWNDVIPRADVVIDLNPYETRTTRVTGQRERFSRDTWIQGDLNLPDVWARFSDREFDFVICSHLLEDIRDPLFVCRQLNRVAKAGYIECPSRFRECAKSHAREANSGYDHHRWIVDVVDQALVFTPKLGWAHFVDYLGDDRRHHLHNLHNHFLAFFWTGSFHYYERFPKGEVVEGANLLYFYDTFEYRRAPIAFDVTNGQDGSSRPPGTCLWASDYRLPLETAGPDVFESYVARYRSIVDGGSKEADRDSRPLRYELADRLHLGLMRTPGLRWIPRLGRAALNKLLS